MHEGFLRKTHLHHPKTPYSTGAFLLRLASYSSSVILRQYSPKNCLFAAHFAYFLCKLAIDGVENGQTWCQKVK
jgi:hypothetical protein